MPNNSFHKYLITLGFTKKELTDISNENIFSYHPNKNAPAIKYILVNNSDEIFKYHLKLWNRNIDNTYIAVSENKTFIIDCKKKPKKGTIASIESFNYGTNSKGYESINIDLISKSYIDSSYFYQFIQQNQRKKQEVDKDLLLNLITLRNDLLEKGNEKIIHLLILRSLFIKYLEDRGIFPSNFLSDILLSKSPKKLISAFNEVRKINGDVFGDNTMSINDIHISYLEKLYLFFTTDYQSGQGTLFPYQFNNIPIQLISHVYEAFLNNKTKKGKGVYYTPSFVVDFMLSQTLKKKVIENPYLTVFDPAVGSAAYLVQSFKIIRDAQAKIKKRNLTYNEKKNILENQLYGVDIDSEALQIATFSLYLVLLEDETSEFIKNKIENSSPILPSLIDKMLICANTIIDDVFCNKKFDFIVSNPPWGSVPNDDKKEHISERKAINNINGDFPEFSNVADYERSQAFLRRIERWQKPDTLITMIVKNSIFLNDKAIGFRQEFIEKNQLSTFYELSNYNKILFKKKSFKSSRVNIEIGASEPCAIVIFKPNPNKNNYKINYISPKLTKLGEHFEIIQYTNNESFLIDKSDFLESDLLWRVLVNSDYEGFNLINRKVKYQNEIEIEARAGFQPKQNMKQFGEPVWKRRIEPQDFEAFYLKRTELNKFNWNQELHRRRDENIFNNSRILLPVRPLKNDKLKLRGIHLENEVVYSDNIISIKLKNVNDYIYALPYTALINSKLLSFYFYQISSQWGKGAEKRAKLRNVDLETLPIKNIKDDKTLNLITQIINTYRKTKNDGENGVMLLNELDKIVFDLYGLTEYEKEIINEFYQVNVERSDKKLKFVQPRDIVEYFNIFKEIFNLVLSPNHTINALYSISQNVGTIIKISIVEKNVEKNIGKDDTLQVLNFVKNKQLSETDKLLKEEKIKLYEPTHFYLIKSNQFKDWTKRKAYKDAKEEIDLLLSKLPNTHE